MSAYGASMNVHNLVLPQIGVPREAPLLLTGNSNILQPSENRGGECVAEEERRQAAGASCSELLRAALTMVLFN